MDNQNQDAINRIKWVLLKLNGDFVTLRMVKAVFKGAPNIFGKGHLNCRITSNWRSGYEAELAEFTKIFLTLSPSDRAEEIEIRNAIAAACDGFKRPPTVHNW